MGGKDFKFLGRIENHEVLNTYILYDVDFFVNLSDSEGLPVSIMEAISIGIPVIARDVGGINEIVNDDTGLLIKEKVLDTSTYQKINNEFEIRLSNLDKYKEKKNNCIRFWEKNFDSFKNYKSFFNSFKFI